MAVVVHRISYLLSLVKRLAVALIILQSFRYFTYFTWLATHVEKVK